MTEERIGQCREWPGPASRGRCNWRKPRRRVSISCSSAVFWRSAYSTVSRTSSMSLRVSWRVAMIWFTCSMALVTAAGAAGRNSRGGGGGGGCWRGRGRFWRCSRFGAAEGSAGAAASVSAASDFLRLGRRSCERCGGFGESLCDRAVGRYSLFGGRRGFRSLGWSAASAAASAAATAASAASADGEAAGCSGVGLPVSGVGSGAIVASSCPERPEMQRELCSRPGKQGYCFRGRFRVSFAP